MRKWLTVVLAVLFVFLAFAEAKKITIWTSEAQVPILKKLADQYKAKYGVQVDVIQVNFGDIKSKFLTAAPAGEGPDIIVGAHDWVGELVVNGLLEPINLPEKEKYFPAPLQGFTYNGKVYGVPYAFDGPALMYNKDYVQNPPKTFDELIALAKKIEKDYGGEVRGFIYDYKNFYFSSFAFFGMGGYVFGTDKTGKINVKDVGLANAGAIEGLKLIKKLVDEKILTPGDNYNTMDGLFKDGLAAMIINGPWAVPGYKQAGINFDVAPIPDLPGGKKPKPFFGAQGFMVNAKSKNKLFALDFLTKFIATKDIMYQIWQADPRCPSRTDVNELVMAKDPLTKKFADFLGKYGLPMPNVPEMAAVWGAMGDALAKALDQGVPAEKALADAVAQIKAQIK